MVVEIMGGLLFTEQTNAVYYVFCTYVLGVSGRERGKTRRTSLPIYFLVFEAEYPPRAHTHASDSEKHYY